MKRIVIGVDGSESSARALRWAVDEAGRAGATVEAVHAWHQPYIAEYPYAAVAFDPEPFEDLSRRLLADAVAQAAVDGVAVEPVLVQGMAAPALLEAAKGADLLVVGSRGHGGFSGLLLGSVSQHVAQHSPCPVVIVPEPRD